MYKWYDFVVMVVDRWKEPSRQRDKTSLRMEDQEVVLQENWIAFGDMVA